MSDNDREIFYSALNLDHSNRENATMKINYNFSADLPLSDPTYAEKAKRMKRAGVETIWLFGYFYGRWDTSVEKLERAKRILEDDGFEVGAINVPFGHGGNSLDPNDPTISLDIGAGWRSRVDVDGNTLYNTTCVNDKLLHDSAEVARALKSIGISKVFYDDDLRLGMWGADLQGCFCDACLDGFRNRYGVNASPKQIVADPELSEQWKQYQCGALLRYIQAVTLPDMTTGVMVMHNGDRRHGVDIELIRQTVPSTIFRVGEGHFDDASWLHPQGQQAIAASIHTHMRLVGDDDLCYSESTVFPANALSPENWIRKIELEIHCGLRNIYLMSGTWFFTPEYWDALAEALPALRELAATTPRPDHPVCDLIWHL